MVSKKLKFKKDEWVKFLDDNCETHFGQVISGYEIAPRIYSFGNIIQNERIVYCVNECNDNSLWFCREDDLEYMSKEELNTLLKETLKAAFTKGKELFSPDPIF